MKIEHIEYDAEGRILTPGSTLGMVRSLFPSDRPTVEPGFYHRHKIREGATMAQARRSLAEFNAAMRGVDGYVLLDAREYTVQMGGYRRIGVEILYAVEDVSLTPEQRARVRHSHLYLPA